MGYYGKLKEKGLAISLRKEGKSYRYIQKEVGVSMDTVSRWCKEIELSLAQIAKLYQNRVSGQKIGSLKGAKKNQEKRIQKEIELLTRGQKEVGEISKRDRFIAGISLYFAEGSKTGLAVEFTNTDPSSIVFMVIWMEEFLKINRKELRFSLWLHDDLNENIAKDYWCKTLKVSPTQFHKTYLAKNKVNSRKVRKNVHDYGIIKIRHYNVNDLRLIKGWISGILTQNAR